MLTPLGTVSAVTGGTGDGELFGDGRHQGAANVAFEAERELVAMGEAGGKRIGDQESGGVMARRDLGSGVQQRRGSRIWAISGCGKRTTLRSEPGSGPSSSDSLPPAGW